MFDEAVRGMIIEHLLRFTAIHLLVAVVIFTVVFIFLSYRHLPRHDRMRIVFYAFAPATIYLVGVTAFVVISASWNAPGETEIIDIETPSTSSQEAAE